MTREEQIRINAIQYSDHESETFVNYPMQEAVLSFQAGVKWADANPNWHKYPDEKPEKTDRYLIAFYWPEFNRNEVAAIYYNKITDTWGITDQQTKHWKIFAWMELPKPPKFD